MRAVFSRKIFFVSSGKYALFVLEFCSNSEYYSVKSALLREKQMREGESNPNESRRHPERLPDFGMIEAGIFHFLLENLKKCSIFAVGFRD